MTWSSGAASSILSPYAGAMQVEVRSLGNELCVDDRLAYNRTLSLKDGRLSLDGDDIRKTALAKARRVSGRWADLIGEYGWDHDVLYILEKDGKLQR